MPDEIDPFTLEPIPEQEKGGLFSDPDNPGVLVSQWVSAPADSHVQQYRLFDRSQTESGPSEIQITFRGGGKTHRPASTYTYTIYSHDTAKAIFEELKGAEHPGEVIHQRLKLPRVPYEGPFYV